MKSLQAASTAVFHLSNVSLSVMGLDLKPRALVNKSTICLETEDVWLLSRGLGLKRPPYRIVGAFLVLYRIL